MIDPMFWEDPETGILSAKTRLLFIGMISQADDEGRGQADPALFRRLVFGFDVDTTVEEVDMMMNEIGSLRSVMLYEAESRRFYALLNWKRYQTINRPSPSRIPAPPGVDSEPRELTQVGQVYQKWEALTGTITSFAAQDLGSMIDEWESHLQKLPASHPNRLINGPQAVIDAIDATGRGAAKPHLNYTWAVLRNWMTNGYKSKKPGDSKESRPVQESYSADEVEKARKRAK